MTRLVPFTGTVPHIITHPLLCPPSRAFHGPMAKGYNQWSIHARGYIPVDPHRMFTQRTVAGRTMIAPPGPLLPKAGSR